MSENSSFDEGVLFEDQFSMKRIRIPAKSHKRLNHFLQRGRVLDRCRELVQMKKGRFNVRIFVQKEVTPVLSKKESLGADVGLIHSVARFDGY